MTHYVDSSDVWVNRAEQQSELHFFLANYRREWVDHTTGPRAICCARAVAFIFRRGFFGHHLSRGGRRGHKLRLRSTTGFNIEGGFRISQPAGLSYGPQPAQPRGAALRLLHTHLVRGGSLMFQPTARAALLS
ncbi:MAG TPA: hypothetical protein VLG74_15140, partial [Blastocatellia bacterium]|nr:hypothetical protein [Blastocatellia bacterium]